MSNGNEGLALDVICRIGSLEIVIFDPPHMIRVICRIGSLEIQNLKR